MKNRNLNIVRKIANKADLITLRDKMSADELERMKITRPKIKITADPAIILDGSSEERVGEIFENEGILPDKKYIGISVRNWGRNDAAFFEKIAEIADYAYKRHGIVPVFIPMRYPADVRASEEVIAKMKCPSHILKEKYGVFDTIAITRKMSMVIGLIYDPKNRGFMDYIGQTYMENVENIDIAKIKGYIDEIAGSNMETTQIMQKRCEELKKLAYENAYFAEQLLGGKKID